MKNLKGKQVAGCCPRFNVFATVMPMHVEIGVEEVISS